MLYIDLGGAGQGASSTLWEPLRASGTSGTFLGASGSLWEPVDDFLYNGIHAQSGAHFGGKPLQHHIQDMHLEASTGLQGSANDALLAFKTTQWPLEAL